MNLRERVARAIWEKRPDGGLMGRPFPFPDDRAERNAYHTGSLDGLNGRRAKVAVCDLCLEYADAALAVIYPPVRGPRDETNPLGSDK